MCTKLDEITSKVLQVVEKYNRNIDEEISISTHLQFDLGISSMSLVAIIADLEDACDVQFEFSEYKTENFETVRAMIALIERKTIQIIKE